MKIYVDELPYYGEYCPFKDTCWQSETDDCPRHWYKYKVCNNENPHECLMLIEKYNKENIEALDNNGVVNCCKNCINVIGYSGYNDFFCVACDHLVRAEVYDCEDFKSFKSWSETE